MWLPDRARAAARRILANTASAETPAWGGSPGVDPALAGVERDSLRMPAAFSALAAPPVFIAGSGRSGATLTLDLFTRHPEVSTIFESWLLTPRAGVTGVFHQPQWNAEYYAGQVERVGHRHAAVAVLSYEQAAHDLGDLLAGWMMRRLEPGCRFLVEKGPVDVEALAALFPEARLIHVIRDGRDRLRSVQAAARSWAPEMWRETSVAAHASFWCRRVRELRDAELYLGTRYLELRFEELRTDIRGTARRLFAFAEIPFDDALLDEVVEATRPAAHPVSARASGFRGEGRIGGWRESMTRSDGRRFDAIAGELLVELGYAPDRGWWRELPRRVG